MTSNYTHIHLNTVDSTNTYVKDLVLGRIVPASSINDCVTTEIQKNSDTLRSAGYPDSRTLLPLLVTADQQTAGRGRIGHTFLSPAGSGIYMSYAYERNYTEKELLNVTTRAAELILPVLQRHYNPLTNSTVMAVRNSNEIPECSSIETLENVSNKMSELRNTEKFALHIKPINDIYIGDPADPDSRKIVGILTERVDYPKTRIPSGCAFPDNDTTNEFHLIADRSSATRPNYFIIVGIGIDCFPFDVPDDLKDKIGFLEPDCSMQQLTEEIADILAQL